MGRGVEMESEVVELGGNLAGKVFLLLGLLFREVASVT